MMYLEQRNIRIVFKQLVSPELHMKNFLGLGGGATVGIVGAGLSGIELASEFRESRPDLKIKLFDRSPRILRDFPED